MLVVCNGNPKAGLHVLTKTVELLGVPWDHTGQNKPGHCTNGHWPHIVPPPELLKRLPRPALIPDGKHIHIYRHPKNMLISWVRFTRNEVAPGFLISAMKSYYLEEPIYEEFMGYVGYLDNPDILNIRFEDLIADKEDQRIADFIETPLLQGIVERRPKGTRTWTVKLSNWKEYWTDEIDLAWVKARGPEIEEAFGYGGD